MPTVCRWRVGTTTGFPTLLSAGRVPPTLTLCSWRPQLKEKTERRSSQELTWRMNGELLTRQPVPSHMASVLGRHPWLPLITGTLRCCSPYSSDLGYRFSSASFFSLCSAELSLTFCGEWGLLFIVVCGLLLHFSCGRTQALGAQASVAVGHGLSCSSVCGIFPDQGIEPVPPALAGRFYPLHHQKSPRSAFL